MMRLDIVVGETVFFVSIYLFVSWISSWTNSPFSMEKKKIILLIAIQIQLRAMTRVVIVIVTEEEWKKQQLI